MQHEQRFFAEGLDTDSAPPLRSKGSYISAVNMHLQGAERGSLSSLLGNVALPSLVELVTTTLPGTYTLLGGVSDDEKGEMFLFLYRDASPDEGMIVYVDESGEAFPLLREGWVTGGLGWSTSDQIEAVVMGNFIVFTDKRGEVRYVNRTKNYSGGITAGELSLSTEPPQQALSVTRDNGGSSPNSLQRSSVQVAARYVLQDGTYSVLGPYSLTSVPPTSEELEADPLAGNSIDITLPTTVKIPSTWSKVDIVARFVDSDLHAIIKTFDRGNTTDAAAVTAHNSGTTLSYAWTTGATKEVLDKDYAAKSFDAVPFAVKDLTAVANRLQLYGFTEGYDTPATAPDVTATPVTANVAAPDGIITSNGSGGTANDDRAEIWFGLGAGNWWYYAYVFVIDGTHHVLPEPPFFGAFNDTSGISGGGYPYTVEGGDDATGAFHYQHTPRVVSRSRLVAVTAGASVPEAYGLGVPYAPSGGSSDVRITTALRTAHKRQDLTFSGAQVFWVFPCPNAHFIVEDDAAYAPPARRQFVPGATYRHGIQYFDTARRRSGVVEAGQFTAPLLEIGVGATMDGEVLERIDLAPSTALQSAIPSWATHWAPTISANSKAETHLTGVAGMMKWVFKEGGGSYNLNRSTADISGAYGVALPLDALSASSIGYTPSPGDLCDLTIADVLSGAGSNPQENITLRVEGMSGGYVILTGINSAQRDILERNISSVNYTFIVEADEDKAVTNSPGIYYRQSKIAYTLYTPQTSEGSMFEIGYTGIVEQGVGGAYLRRSDGTAGAFTVSLYGDTYGVERTNLTGAAQLPAVVPNEATGTLKHWVGDRGRITPSDSVGRKTLGSSVRWSNSVIPGAQQSGLASFDSQDVLDLDVKTGDITAAIPIAESGSGASILVLARTGSYVLLVERSVLTAPDGTGSLAQSSRFLSVADHIPWGCQSPRAVVRGKGGIFWPDALRREVLLFDGQAKPISRLKTTNLWQEALGGLFTEGHRRQVSAGYHSGKGNYFLTIRAAGSAYDLLPTTTTRDPFKVYSRDATATYIFDEQGAWVGRYDTSPAMWLPMRAGLYKWANGRLYQEFTASGTTYDGVAKKASVAIAFAGDYSRVKTPMALIVDSDVAPESDWCLIQHGSEQQLTQVAGWKERDGMWYGDLLFDRLSSGATTVPDGDLSQFKGARLKGQTANVWLQWPSGDVRVTSVALSWVPANGH